MADRQLEGLNSNTLAFLNLKSDKIHIPMIAFFYCVYSTVILDSCNKESRLILS